MNTTQDWAERGGDMIPNDTYSYRPVCKVIATGRHPEDQTSRAGMRFFVAKYPTGEQYTQWEDAGPRARFVPLHR